MKKEVPVSIVREMKQSYLDYSMSVIVGRALPDARDGFKPVHRRILYAMHDEGLLSNRRYSKCAGVVGEVLKKYHPHGDSAVYDALVRLAQPWAMRYPLVDGQGNFGSIDGDPAAAYRYTESRMTSLAEEMLGDIDKDTVDWQANFDEQTQEPLVLPARFPNLLVNGSSGIAVGMATNIPPHNMREVCHAVLAMLKNPDIEIEELMEIVKGPDFPTGAIICGHSGINDAYHTGRGKVILRAKTHFEEMDNGASRIVVDEIPYMVNKAKVAEKIADLVKEGRLEGISEVRDESDRHGMRLVVELKRGEIPEVTLNKLFQMTPLQSTFGIIMLALVDKQPRVLNLKEMLNQFVAFRREVVLRRTAFLLNKAERRAHILAGFVKALDILDELIALIRASRTPEEARNGMIDRWQFSELQAQSILDLRLQKLTGMEREAIQREYEEIQNEIAGLKRILEVPEALIGVLTEETQEIIDKYGDDRRTQIADFVGDFSVEDLIADEAVVLTCSHRGYIKQTPLTTYREQRRGGKGRLGMRTHDDDFVEHMFVASTHDTLMIFTSLGKVHWIKVHQIPQTDPATKGKAIVNLIQVEEGEKPVAFHAVREFDEGTELVFCTQRGIIKKTNLAAFKNVRAAGIRAINISEDDALLSVRPTDGNREIVLATLQGKAIRFHESDIRSMGRSASGVIGIRLAEDDRVVEMAIIEHEDGHLLTVSQNGYGKRTAINEYRLQGRGGSGILNMRVTEKTGLLAAVRFVQEGDSALIISLFGKLIRMDLATIRPTGRVTQGVRLLNLDEEEDMVVDCAILPEEMGEVLDDEDLESEENGVESPPNASGDEAEPGEAEAPAEN
ncbi:MAG: DNA gyrase subunit A [Acidobacteria bacterium]|nr:DNA gyrase subunit A [Acidobacteriota bacterium]MCB9396275.1 DNA gyrase subunit A [Acidobacteriota bacterium]